MHLHQTWPRALVRTSIFLGNQSKGVKECSKISRSWQCNFNCAEMVAVESPESQSLLGQRLAVCQSVNIVVQQLRKEQRIRMQLKRRAGGKLITFKASEFCSCSWRCLANKSGWTCLITDLMSFLCSTSMQCWAREQPCSA